MTRPATETKYRLWYTENGGRECGPWETRAKNERDATKKMINWFCVCAGSRAIGSIVVTRFVVIPEPEAAPEAPYDAEKHLRDLRWVTG